MSPALQEMNPIGTSLLFLILVGFSARAAPGIEVEIDFSTCGYRQSGTAIPLVPIRAVVTEGANPDDGARIQAAIDHVAGLEVGPNGFRGAVLLKGKNFNIGTGLVINKTGVVLRGCGTEQTTLKGTSVMREPLIRVVGVNDVKVNPGAQVMDETVAAGAIKLIISDATGFAAGERIFITRPCTAEWIESIGMKRTGIAWKPGSRDIRWERVIVGINGNEIEFDAPITTALEKTFGGGRVEKFSWPGRISNVGIENLKLMSETVAEFGTNEDRPWCGVTMENIENAWVRQVTFAGFPGSAVALEQSAKNITVEDCISEAPQSELGGYRRHTFFTRGEQTLFLRCWAEEGRHDFSVGHGAAGPNTFVACRAERAHDFSGAIESWASGILFDNVSIDGAGLALANRWRENAGAGWSAANSIIWQSNAADFRCFNPPGAWNKAFGTWGLPIGDGGFNREYEFVRPRSLFQAQLAMRLGGGEEPVEHLGPIGRDYPGATNPKPAQVEEFLALSNAPAPTLKETIQAAARRDPLWDESRDAMAGAVVDPEVQRKPKPAKKRPMAIRQGSLQIGDLPLRGKRFTPIWWRGNTRPAEAPAFGPAITRFVPGKIGTGYTDDLVEVADEMVRTGKVILEHHHGLWYDRRRDDHTRVRRSNGNVIPPFYEMPFARSGEGLAWDGLSKYDLTRFNPWYWNRLSAFAELCDERELVLLHQHYFQHNILEAGAHWADYPWRSANNINDTAFPEPPPYAGDKRIFQAHLFYDVSHPQRRDLHRGYIRQCLANTADNSHVIHSTGAEFTGPLAFVEFWIDTCLEWERETGRDAVLSLSCTKDVQDAILEDPIRSSAISVIDIRYWWYGADGTLYAPPGGKNLSPRQHQRQIKPEKPSEESKKRAVAEYRERYPDKAVFVNGEPAE
ncbi:MAG: hypothetical protein ACI957_000353 [Verrucomicrobiales bacterium]|jgi:hypothetical protein